MRASRFTDKDKKAMSAEYKSGSTIRDLAEAWDCSTPTIIRLLTGDGTKMRKRGRRLGVKVPRKPGHKKPGPKVAAPKKKRANAPPMKATLEKRAKAKARSKKAKSRSKRAKKA